MKSLVFCALLVPTAALAQDATAFHEGRLGPREILPRDHEIALARSAAPSAVSGDATVWVFTETGYEVAVEGKTGVACYVGRSWPTSIEPHCHDAEGAATIMQIHMREGLLLHQSVPGHEIERQIGQALLNGELQLPSRPAMSWMMSSAQELISDEGQAAGAWKPHLMIYYPYLSAQETGLAGTPDFRHAILVSPGHATSNFMIVVTEAIDPVFTQAARGD